MINRIMFWGEIIEILFSSNKKMEFVLEDKADKNRATITVYNDDLFKFIKKRNVVTIQGYFREVPFLDGRNYIIKADKIVPYVKGDV